MVKGFIVIGTKGYNFTNVFDCPIGRANNEYYAYCPVTNKRCDWDTCPALVPTGRWWEE